MWRALVIIFGCSLPLGLSAAENSVDLSFNDDAVRAQYGFYEDARDLALDAGVLHDRDSGTLFHLGVLGVGETGSRSGRLRAGLGARLAYADGRGSSREGLLLAPGGMVSWKLPRAERLVLSAEAYFAPDILTGGDLEDFIDATIRASFQVNDRAALYVGGRYVRGKYDDSRSTIFDNGAHIGLRLGF